MWGAGEGDLRGEGRGGEACFWFGVEGAIFVVEGGFFLYGGWKGVSVDVVVHCGGVEVVGFE